MREDCTVQFFLRIESYPMLVESDAYSDADEREEMIELRNDAIDTLVNDSQDASSEGIDNNGWDRDRE